MNSKQTAGRNIAVLAAAQALGGASPPIVMSLGGLVGLQLASNPAWATFPVSLFGLGLAFRADGRALVEIVEFRFAVRTDLLCAKIRISHV